MIEITLKITPSASEKETSADARTLRALVASLYGAAAPEPTLVSAPAPAPAPASTPTPASAPAPIIRIMAAARATLEAAGHKPEVMAGRASGKNGMVTQSDVATFLRGITPADKPAPCAPAEKPLSYARVREVAGAVMQEVGGDPVRALVAKYDAHKISGIAEESWPQFIADLQGLLK